jgi:parallel beta-helix repeat protein
MKLQNKFLFFSVIFTIALAIVFSIIVKAQTQEELQTELSQLEQELTNSGYSWLINYNGIVDNVKINNYSCSSTGYETSKVLTQGAHHLEFNFGGVIAYAHNWADDATLLQNVSGCGSLTTANAIYNLNISISNQVGTCFTIGANNVTLDLNGYTVDGDDSGTDYGIYSSGYNSSTIRNGTITDFSYGIFLSSSSNNVLTNITVNSNIGSGISLWSNSNNTLTDITANSNTLDGITFDSSSNNLVANGYVNNSGNNAIVVSNTLSSNNTFENISITNTAGAYYDIKWWSTASISGTILRNMPHIGNYTFTGVGGTLIVEDTRFGKIQFLNPVNGSGTNLTADIQILNNSVTVRSDVNSGLNKSANVTLYGSPGAGFSFPVILRDGATCPAGICYNYTSLTASTVVFNVSYWTNYSIGYLTNITTCGTLSQSNATYTLQNSISNQVGTCFTIQANNVTLDLNGYTIDGDDVGIDFGITSSGRNFSTIKNGTITDFREGIYLLSGSNNNTVIDITANSNTDLGVYLFTSSNNTLVNIIANSNANSGIYLQSNSNNNVLTNITTSSNTNYGVLLIGTSNNNVLTNITANSNNRGVYLTTSSNNTFINITANSNVYGIYLGSDSENNTISDFKISNPISAGIYVLGDLYNSFENGYINNSGLYGIQFEDEGPVSNKTFKNIWINNTVDSEIRISVCGTSLNNTFLNVTLNNESIYAVDGCGDGVELIRQWYADIQVNDSSGYLASANVNITNSSGVNVFSGTTNATGQVARQILTEYRSYGITFSPVYQTPHIFTTDKSGYTTSSSTYNLTSSRNVDYKIILSVPVTPPSGGGGGTTTPPAEEPTCTDACSSGATEKRCSGGVPQQRTCSAGADGCTVWGSWSNLASCTGGKVCSNGECILPTCTDDCSLGQEQKECVNELSSRKKICGNYDADTCLEFGDWTTLACNTGEFCDVDSCVPTCAENWICGDWNTCSNNQQTRTCNDLNSCGTILLKPNLTQSCISGVEIDYSPTDSSLTVSPKESVSFSVSATDLAGAAGISIEWFLNSVSQKQDSGTGSLSSSFTSPANTSGSVKAKISVDGNAQEISWNIEINEEAKEECKPDWRCQWTHCEEGDEYKKPFDCVDINDCGTSIDKPEKKECTCHSKLNCSEWSSCNAVYNVRDVLQDKKSIRGNQERTCIDFNKCEEEATETKPCSLAVPVRSKAVEWCNETYVEIYEESTNKLVSRVKKTELSKSVSEIVDVSLVKTDFKGYCDYCSNSMKDYDEESTDCGGPSCPVCVGKYEFFDWRYWVASFSWGIFALLFSTFLISSRAQIVAGTKSFIRFYQKGVNEEELEKAIEEFFRRLLRLKKQKEIKKAIKKAVKKPLVVEKKLHKEIEEFKKEKKPHLPKSLVSSAKKGLIRQAILRWKSRKQKIKEDEKTLSLISEAKKDIGKTASMISHAEENADKESFMHTVRNSLQKLRERRKKSKKIKKEFEERGRELRKKERDEVGALTHLEKVEIIERPQYNKKSLDEISEIKKQLKKKIRREKKIKKKEIKTKFKTKLLELKREEKEKLNGLIRKEKVEFLDTGIPNISKEEINATKYELSRNAESKGKKKDKHKFEKYIREMKKQDKENLKGLTHAEKVEVIKRENRVANAKRDVSRIVNELKKKGELK